MHLKGEDADSGNATKDLFDFVEQKGGLSSSQTKARIVERLCAKNYTIEIYAGVEPFDLLDS